MIQLTFTKSVAKIEWNKIFNFMRSILPSLSMCIPSNRYHGVNAIVGRHQICFFLAVPINCMNESACGAGTQTRRAVQIVRPSANGFLVSWQHCCEKVLLSIVNYIHYFTNWWPEYGSRQTMGPMIDQRFRTSFRHCVRIGHVSQQTALHFLQLHIVIRS